MTHLLNKIENWTQNGPMGNDKQILPFLFGSAATAWLGGLVYANMQTWDEGNYQVNSDAWYTDPNSPGYWKKGGEGYENKERPDTYYSNFHVNDMLSQGLQSGTGKYGRRLGTPGAVTEGQPTLYDQWMRSAGKGLPDDYFDPYGY